MSISFAVLTGGCAWTSLVSVFLSRPVALDCCESHGPSLSADGRYVAFNSNVKTLVSGDTNETDDVFVRDTSKGTTSRVSVDDNGNQGNAASAEASISSDGRYVAFTSSASNLVPDDTNQIDDVFVRDTVAGTTSRVSLDGAGNQTAIGGNAPAISGDGRYVAFIDFSQILIRDRIAGTTNLVSVADNGEEADRGAYQPSISADGRYVAFASFSTNLVEHDNNISHDVFVRDTVAGTTRLVDLSSSGVQADSFTTDPSISADGRYVAFKSIGDNLVPGDTNDNHDIFLRDLVAGTTIRVNVNDAGAQTETDKLIWKPVVSGDGRYVAFQTLQFDLVAGDPIGNYNIFVHDTVAGTTRRVSVPSNDADDGGASDEPAISADGRYIAFSSTGDLAGENNPYISVFVRANPDPAATGVIPATLHRGTTVHITVTGSSFIDSAQLVIDGGGITLANVTVVSLTRITADATVDTDARLSSRRVFVGYHGTGEGAITGGLALCAGCVTVS